MCRNCTVQCGSHRSISWKSLFDGFRVKPSESNAPKISQSAKEQAKIRTEEAVRRFREAKDRGSDSVISAHVPPQSRLQVAKSPRDRLLELLNERKVHRKNPSELPSSDFIFEPIKSGKLTSTERTSSSSNTVAYDRPAFIYPLRSRQQQAINKFLQIAERKRLKREKYPWEEQSVPFDPEKAAEDDMRDLVTQVGTLDSHVLEAARASSILRTSRFYRQLREHHDSFRGKIGLVSDEELSAADRRLYNSLMPRFQMEAQDKPSLQTLWATLQLLTTSTRTGNKIVTPLLKSTLAREGFDPSRGWDLIESPHSTVTHDNFGRIRAPRLMQISRDTYFKNKRPLLLGAHSNLQPDMIERIRVFPSAEKHLEPSNGMIIVHHASLHLSEVSYEHHSIVLDYGTGGILFRSRDVIQEIADMKITPLKEINHGIWTGEDVLED